MYQSIKVQRSYSSKLGLDSLGASFVFWASYIVNCTSDEQKVPKEKKGLYVCSIMYQYIIMYYIYNASILYKWCIAIFCLFISICPVYLSMHSFIFIYIFWRSNSTNNIGARATMFFMFSDSSFSSIINRIWKREFESFIKIKIWKREFTFRIFNEEEKKKSQKKERWAKRKKNWYWIILDKRFCFNGYFIKFFLFCRC